MKHLLIVYRIIFLSFLLISSASFSTDINLRIEELKKAQFKKEVEVSYLCKMISERDELLRSFSSVYRDLFIQLRDKELSLLEEKINKKLTTQEKREFSEELRKNTHELVFAFSAACNDYKEIDNMLVKGLFKNNDQENEEFESLKFFLVRCAFERGFMVKLVKKYELITQELIVINKELAQLEKQKDTYEII